MDLSPADIGPVLAETGLPGARAVVPMTGGQAPIFRLDLADGTRLVLKAYPEGSPTFPEKDAYAAGLLDGRGLPVTRYLRVDRSRRLLPVAYVLTTYLPGVTAHALRHHPGIGGIYRGMGALLRRLHDVKLPGYGAFGATGLIAPVHDHAAFIRRLVADAIERFRHHGGDPILAERLNAILLRDLDRIAAQSPGAVFAHDDLHPNNVVVEEDTAGALTLSGIIDFGNARAADATFDLAKCLFCSQHDAPGSRAPMLAGYGRIDHPEPEAALAYYTTLHRVIMWWWLRHIGVLPAADSPNDLIAPLRAAADAGAATLDAIPQ